MDDADLNALMRDLIRAQAYRCGSPIEAILINTDGNAKDDGCDGWTAKPDVNDAWLGNADTCWQIKAGTAGQPKKLKGEITKPIPRKTLKSKGRFIVVASGSTNGKKGEGDRLKALRAEAKSARMPTRKISVIGSERLTAWCNENPAVAARWAGRPEGMWTLADWSSAEIHQVPWQASDTVKAVLAAQRAALDFHSGSLHHLHIQGQPGVGKTRFALELCRDAPWSSFVIYIHQAADLRLQELVDTAGLDPTVRLVLVADEVQPEHLRPLRESIGRANGRIRLITIGHCPTPEPSRIPSLAVQPLDPIMAQKVVNGWYPAMPFEHVNFVVQFADGYIRLARLAADAVAMNAAMDVRDLLGRDEVRIFLDRMLGESERRALYVVAVLTSIGWTGDMEVEGIAVAKHLHLDWDDVREKVDAYHRRFGIAPRGGRYRYISPTPLATYLAVEAWTTYPDLLRTLPNALPTEGAKDAYYERLRTIASNLHAREYARQELDFFFRLSDFVDARTVRRWSALAAADPGKAAQNILRALERSSAEERLHIEGSARREIVWTLVRLCWRTDAFSYAAKALALLGEAENETFANNATSEFIARFQIELGGTGVPYIDRLLLLDELVSDGRLALNRLVLKALARAGDQHAFRMGSEPASDELPEKEWQPANEAEIIQCVQAALDRLTMLSKRAEPGIQQDFIAAANEFSMWLRDASVRPGVARFFEAVRTAYPDAREPLRRMIADLVHREREYWKEVAQEDLAELDALHTCFEDASLTARLRQFVGQPAWERVKTIDFRPLARELLESPGELAGEWAWLTSGEATDAWFFGEALAEVDAAREIASAAISLGEAGRDFSVLCGYICALRRNLGDEWYDRWVDDLYQHHPRPTKILFQIAFRCGITALVAHDLAEVLSTENVGPEVAGQLAFATSVAGLELDPLKEILRAMTAHGHRATALIMLEQRIKAAPAELDKWSPLALELVTTPELIRGRRMPSYAWKELALKFVNEYPGEIAAAIFREQEDRTAGTWFVEHSEAAQVLQECLERDSEAVWQALLPHLSNKVSAYRFSIGFPAAVVERVERERVQAWVDEQPDERAPLIGKFVNMDFSRDDTIAASVIGAYGDKRDVAGAFFAEYVSGMWRGEASVHWEQLAISLDQAGKRTKLSKLRRWATDTARHLRQMAERDRQREEEADVRGRR